MCMESALLLAILILGACSAPDTTPPGVIGDWVLTEGILREAPFLVQGHRITISFSDDGRVGGVAACNSYGGAYVADGEDLIVGEELASTAMACEGPGVMESEQAFLTALRRPLTYVRNGDVLTIEGADVVMTFAPVVPVPQADLLGTEWVLETLISGDTAQSAMADATLQLTADGRVFGSTGCRALEGDYVIDGDVVLFTTFSAIGACAADLAAQDGLVVSVLGDGFTVDIDGDVMTVTSRGNEGLTYRRSG